MGPPLVVSLLLLFIQSSLPLALSLDDILDQHLPSHNIQKREALSRNEQLNYIQQKLIEHSQALEQLVVLAKKNEKMTEKLIEQISSRDIDEPKLPEKIESSRRSLGSDLYNGSDVQTRDQKANKNSTWCAIAVMCTKDSKPVCGFEDNFGYGKFDDICHMLRVNCYWRHDFTLAPKC